ncbi:MULTISPECIES: hypothetical protein [Legionella]|uniref:Uncharacterized protein n=1 Tax=Legionella maceachernii TaxID=466 RepID=A0A0W0W1B8_9GAMM|nr:hypothetical protein [Legionella maceachernii]KTD25966.1 hypothetical protein Lmac_1737 [Legionella maceachernii]SJZ49569.1 hypothetical protein SAMN02745128_00244 [Legionella maceachernii]SUP03788.1 Uncharacterised protein [Legionella maceachernii]
MRLTDWWNALITDLDRLKVLVKQETSNSEAWTAAMTMATEGREIEANLFAARTREANIKKASEKLGAEYTSSATEAPQYLPNVTNPDELLFAMVFYQHLNRYAQINEGNSLVLNGVRANDAVVQANMIELKKRIEAYCNNEEEANKVKETFPGVTQQAGANLFEKVQNMLSELPLEDKLIGQFEEDAKKKIDEYDQANVEYNQSNIASLFTELDAALKKKEKILREIAEYKKFIEELPHDDSLLDRLKDDNAHELEQTFPRVAGELRSLDTPDTERSGVTKVAVTATRAVIGAAETVGGWTNYLIGGTVGRVMPQGINNLASSLVSMVSGIKDTVKPLSNVAKKKETLIEKAQQQINDLADGLNSGDDPKFKVSGKDFEKLSSKQVDELADKVATIRYIVHIQKCLALYEQKQATGIAKVTQIGLFKPIVNWLSTTSFRRLMHDKILLISEAENLEKQLESMKEKFDKGEASYGHAELTDDLHNALEKTARKAEKIHSKSIYTMFSATLKEESERAKDDLKKVTEVAAPPRTPS